MRIEGANAAKVSMLIDASPDAICTAFTQPEWLTRYWLTAADAPLALGRPSKWSFMVRGETAVTIPTRLDPERGLSWDWADGASVTIDFEPIGSATAVTIVVTGFPDDPVEQVQAALNACEGFAIVLCDLKTLLETGTSAGLVAAKARLIERRKRTGEESGAAR